MEAPSGIVRLSTEPILSALKDSPEAQAALRHVDRTTFQGHHPEDFRHLGRPALIGDLS